MLWLLMCDHDLGSDGLCLPATTGGAIMLGWSTLFHLRYHLTSL